MAQRPFYEPDEYARLNAQLQQLLATCTPVALDADTHHVEVVPAGLGVTYVSSSEMPRFAELAQFDSRSIKLINYGRPATRLHYRSRHRYQIQKNLSPEAVKLAVADILEALSGTDPTDAAFVALLQRVAQQPEAFEVARSNYHQHYTYPYIVYRYRDGQGYATANAHLTQGINVVFVDLAAIAQEQAPRDDEQARAYLASFPDTFDLGKHRLLIKEKVAESLHDMSISELPAMSSPAVNNLQTMSIYETTTQPDLEAESLHDTQLNERLLGLDNLHQMEIDLFNLIPLSKPSGRRKGRGKGPTSPS